MPLSGETIRLMNYVDDIATTMRRIVALMPSLTPEEKKRLAEYLRASKPNAEEILSQLES